MKRPIRLSEYRPPDHLVDKVELDVSLHPSETRVKAQLSVRPNPAGRAGAPLVLDGDGLVAVSLALDGRPLDLALARPDGLVIDEPPRRPFRLTIETRLDPSANTQLMGLYKSGGAYCTQCEAEGFRRITYFPDRPDVLSVYETRVEGAVAETPILLSNGNLAAKGPVAGDPSRHFALWKDPFPKPCYLFALVGGDLGALRDSFTTRSGRRVELGVYVEHGKEERAAYAMDSLKRAMRWDEERFGREYDLDVFNIVAVPDFNMGAMENKGLNIFNDKYILASPETATDADYAGIESVVAHEYFHNWTGNRITCRDWFQLCLKEGLTVYRDQEFSADQRSRAVRRIADVRVLRAQQFPEDSGPLAHNVRPDSYVEINNFYTPTVYEKGAEIVRMLAARLGREAFAAGMDLYFSRCDGTAATVEDFLSCFEDAAGVDLTQFKLWYEQAGTPVVTARSSYDPETDEFSLELTQRTPPTPGQSDKRPLVVPVALGLVAPDGSAPPLVLRGPGEFGGADAEEASRGIFLLTGESRRLTFLGLPEKPAPSLLRGFSAPVRLDSDLLETDLLHLLAHDADPMTRWQSAQTCATRIMLRSIERVRAGHAAHEDERFTAALRSAVLALRDDPAFAALLLVPPSEIDLAREIGSDVDPDAVRAAREALRAQIGGRLRSLLIDLRGRSHNEPYSPDATQAGRRALANTALDLLCAADPTEGADLARLQFDAAGNMTDRFAALAALSLIPGDQRERALADFYAMFETESLVIDKWFALQASIPERGTLARVRALMLHEVFTLTNPNRLRALVGSFAGANPTQFNAVDGSGYAFLAETALEVDAFNSQVAARLLNAFRSWRAMEPARREQARAALSRLAAIPSLSTDVRDIVDRALG